jgi:hypothetical protein
MTDSAVRIVDQKAACSHAAGKVQACGGSRFIWPAPLRSYRRSAGKLSRVARFLTEFGIDSISVNPASIMRTMTLMRHAEDLAKREPW